MIFRKIIAISAIFRVTSLTLAFALALIIIPASFANFAYPQPSPQGGININPNLPEINVDPNLINPNLPEEVNIDPNDPSQAPIPQLDFNDTAKSVVVRLHFTNQGEVTVNSIEVNYVRAHTHVGDPPLLDVQLFNDTGELINQFNAWNPLWAFEWESTRGEFPTLHEKRILLPNANASIIFPFDRSLASMTVSDIPQNKELISVDLQPTIREFCEENSDDVDCTSNMPTGQAITVEINATITEVNRPDVFGGVISVGDTITGSYTYDPSTADTSPNDTASGTYPYVSNPFDITLNVKGFTFQSDPQDVNGGIRVVNGEPGTPNNVDEIQLVSLNNLPVNATDISQITLDFIDRTGSAISSDSLPSGTPDLNNVWNETFLEIDVPNGAFIGANITSAKIKE